MCSLHLFHLRATLITTPFNLGLSNSNVIIRAAQGEPLLSLPSVVKAYHLLNQQVGIGGRFITISTVGQ
jgi:23S rRNA (adenine2503-C2)-methyltransferase